MKKTMLAGLGAMVLLSGCGTTVTQDTAANTPEGRANFAQNRRGGFGGGMGSSTMFMLNSATGTVADLGVGKRVLVMGTTGSDGIVQAQRIITGFGAGFGGRPEGATGTPRMMATGASRGQGRTSRGQGVNNLNGEIISLDATSLTIKKRDGGSAIVFYSAKTDIRIAASSTPVGLPTSTGR